MRIDIARMSIGADLATHVVNAKKRLGVMRDRSVLAWPVAALALCALGWAVLLGQLEGERYRAEGIALKQAASLAKTYAEQIARTVEAVDQNLRHLRFEWTFVVPSAREGFLGKDGILSSSALVNVSIVNRDGAIADSTHAVTSKDPALGAPHLLIHQTVSEDFLYIGDSEFDPAANIYAISFSRKIVGKGNSFDGIVKMEVAPSYFTDGYDEATLGTRGLMGVVGADGLIRVTRIGKSVYPPAEAMLSKELDFLAASGSRPLLGNEWFNDRRTRYVGWATVHGYPLIAVVGLDERDTLAAYSASRATNMLYATSATMALVVFTLIAMALSTRLAWRKHKLETTQAGYRMATEGGNEGFYIVRPLYNARKIIADFEIVDHNHRGAAMLRELSASLVGRRFSELHHKADGDRLIDVLRRAMEHGQYEGEVEFFNDGPLAMAWVHIKIVRTDDGLAVTLRDISDTKAHVAELERRSNEDALTGLPNRHWVQENLPIAIESAARNNTMLALLFVDLDGFKRVNDTAGHAVGDEVLRSASRRIKEAVRPNDTVARFGGDEFLVILWLVPHQGVAADIAERIVHAFQTGFNTSKGVHSVGTSIGISLFPEDGGDAHTLLQNGDIAMYSVKTSGKGGYRFFDAKFYVAMRAKLEWESELRRAIERDEFVMHYQPRVDLTTGATCSMEALVRWAHPAKGLLEPVSFIALAEETGLILGLGELVINKVCSQLASWGKSGAMLVPVSMNVSSRQFNEADIALILSEALARHSVAPALVEIEITESSMMGSSIEITRTLGEIRRIGVKLLVDDFGTGYSSLSQLQRLDFDVLKIDRSFTDEIDKSERGKVLIKAIITMAHALGLRVVAEGVENSHQLDILKALNCDEIQGFYICKPMPPPSRSQPIAPHSRFTIAERSHRTA